MLAAAAKQEAVPFDLPRHPELKFTHHDGLCTFEVLLREFELDEPALARLGKIVNAAESREERLRGEKVRRVKPRGDKDAPPEALGLKAIAEGFQELAASDEKRVAWGFFIFDALYAWCQKAAK